jgi:ribosomal 30S subunit maturation factor RimM
MGRFEVPFVDALVPVVDLEEGRVEIVVIPGLIDESG